MNHGTECDLQMNQSVMNQSVCIEQPVERRKHNRFNVPDGTIILTPNNFGTVVNISMSGMLFRYLNWDESSNYKGRLDILFHGYIVLYDFPFILTRSKEEYLNGNSGQWGMKQKRLQFVELTSVQENQLKNFLRNYVVFSA
ncbi:MAG: PilZ domain-containing protein [Thermodesulfobacteriota bacterium]|nr:PilZ domain-containing protein [Thermodesulfobacteriota bacterium]